MISELQDQWLRREMRDVAGFARRACLVRTDSLTSSLHKDVGVQCILPLKRIGFSQSKSKGKGKGKGMGNGPEPVWPIEAGEAHEIKSCATGTLRYRADIPLNEHSGAPVVITPHRRDLVPWDNLIRSGGWSDTDTDWKSTDSG